MDSCCAVMKGIAQPLQIERGFHVEPKVFRGQYIRGSSRNRVFGNRLSESFRGFDGIRSRSRRKIKPGVAFSVFTQDIDKGFTVSFHYISFLFMLSLIKLIFSSPTV